MTKNDLNQIGMFVDQKFKDSENRVISEVGKYMEDEILPVLDSHTKALNQISNKIESINENIQRLDKRVTVAENKLGISSPPELTLVK